METDRQETPARGQPRPDSGILDQILNAGPHPPVVGRFWFYFADERWK